MKQKSSEKQEIVVQGMTTDTSLDKIDIKQQFLIQSQLEHKLNDAFEKEIELAIHRSLSESTVASSSIMDNDVNIGNEGEGDTPRSRRAQYQISTRRQSERQPSLERSSGQSLDQHHNRSPSPDRLHHQHQDSEERSSFRKMNQQTSERRPSLERINQQTSERRPSLERIDQQRSERRPSLERINQQRSERQPSLERIDQQRSERRPSLERIDQQRSERRPSLERINQKRSERRPSLERINQQMSERRPSLERINQQRSERRPSLERINQRSERRHSLERMQQHRPSYTSDQGQDGPAQGIDTLHPWPLNYLGVPSNWDMTKIPNVNSGSLYFLVPIFPGDEEYSAICVDFEEAGLRVIKLERLQNHIQLDKFKTEKEHLLRQRHSDFQLNERYLYHGTQANKERICEEGLDGRLSFQGCFGRGIYFSDNPRKCMQYATAYGGSNSEDSVILICRVLLGDSKIYPAGVKDPDLKREPEKPNAKGGWRYYDSVQGTPRDYPEFVVYENRRAMIEYIVTFSEVAYRAPPSGGLNGSMGQSSALYKVEQIDLPIPEKEIDRLYLLGPDTDSDGSCDEHTREVERLRDNVRKAKAKRLGIPYRPPTEEEKRYDRLHWKRVCYYSCPPNSPLYDMMIHKKREEKAERKRKKKMAREQKANEGGRGSLELGATGQSYVTKRMEETDDTTVTIENESVAEVLSNLIADFLNITQTDDVKQARLYIMENGVDLDKALCQYYNEL